MGQHAGEKGTIVGFGHLRRLRFNDRLKINGRQTNAWIDSRSPISIFTVGEMKRTLGTAGVNLNELIPEDDEFRDYGNNPLRLLGTMIVLLETNGWATEARIKVVGRSDAKSGNTTSATNTGAEGDVSSRRTTGAETSSKMESLDPW